MTPKYKQLLQLPLELRERDQWCVAAPDKSPWFVSETKQYRASSTNPNSWMTFAEALRWAQLWQADIGYVLSSDDPFVCIDLDVKDSINAPDKPQTWTTPDRYDQFLNLIANFNSFTERSRSGKGFHIWIRGIVDKGLKCPDLEVYGQERFIICTGAITRDVGIQERQEKLTQLLQELRAEDQLISQAITDGPEIEDDWSVMLRIHNSSQRDKFERLWTGNLEGYPSQSEADAALIQILCYYTENNTQVGRIFLESALGKRDKARAHNYVYLRRSIANARRKRDSELRAERAAIEKATSYTVDPQSGKAINVNAVVEKMQAATRPASRVQKGIHAQGAASAPTALLSPTANAVMGEPEPPASRVAGEHGLPWPPGVMGQIARFIFRNSVRPAKEVSIVAAIGMMAGICGQAWHIPQSGLNMYVVLIAKSAVGKEAMHTGISTILSTIAKDKNYPTIWQFFDYMEHQSGQSLIKSLADKRSVLNVLGEWGKRLKLMSSTENSGALATLRTQMTNLYQKSGPQSIMAGLGYSDAEKNVQMISGVAYSMIGETTPQTYYEALTPAMMEDGFLSRFLMIEYKGDRVPMNLEQEITPSDNLCQCIIELCDAAVKIPAMQDNKEAGIKSGSMLVTANDEAREAISAFERECDANINGTDDESRRQMWNRASLKSMRLAALIAVGDNHKQPVMTAEHVAWAQLVIRRDIAAMVERLDNGDVGSGDGPRERKVVSVLNKYLARQPGPSYKVPSKLWQNRIIPRSYIHNRVSNHPAFVTAREGVRNALENVIRNCLDNGYIMEVNRVKLADDFDYFGKAYRVLELPDYEAMESKEKSYE